MENDRDNKDNKSDQFSNEVISPIFGHDYKNRVVTVKSQVNKNNQFLEEVNYLEKQIEQDLEAKIKIDKAKEYEETLKIDTDVLKQYQLKKEYQDLKDSLPSNYLDFLDNLEKTSDLSTISDFNFLETDKDYDEDFEINNTNKNSEN